jgi:hypothetical protein
VTTTEQPVMVDILTAAEQAIAVMRQHQLTPATFEVAPGQPGAKGWNFAEKAHTRPILTEIQLCMFGKPAEFLRWAEHLNVERILVQRREFDTCLHADADRDGLRWSIHTDTRRPYDGKHLPGITVDWIRQDSGRRGNEARITLSDLRATFAALGVVDTAGAKGGQS